MIGYRGCYRYVDEPDLFRLELDVLAQVREETPNLHLMIPFVRTAWELEALPRPRSRAHPTAVAACPVGDGRGAVGRRTGSRRTPAWASTASRSAPTTSPS